MAKAKTVKQATKVEATVSFPYFLDPDLSVKEQKANLKEDLVNTLYAIMPDDADHSLVKSKVEFGPATKGGKLPVKLTAKYPVSIVAQFYGDEQRETSAANVKEFETEALGIEFAGYSDNLKVKVTAS